MNDSQDPGIEDRLRTHYRLVRTQPPTDHRPHRESRLLVGVCCLIVALAAGGLYLGLGSAEPGQPINADVGAVPDSSPDGSPALSVTTLGETTVVSTSESPSTTTAEPDLETTAGSSSSPTADTGQHTQNIDGSPRAPTPGTMPPPAGASLSMAYGIWEPSSHDSCSKAVHDKYWVYGPDGKVYPTYHPPIDPATGCTFGHEHGRDPAGSDLADIPFPFGYVSEQVSAAGATGGPQDHVGHKIEWLNDGGYYETGSPTSSHDQICDVAYKVHMDTHSDAAFWNNAHEVFHYARCENGSELIYRALHNFGDGGEFQMHCDQRAGPTVTGGQGDDPTDGRPGSREIPASECFADRVLVPEGQRSEWFPFDERWTLYHSVDSEEFGRFFIQFYFFAEIPSRYWDGEKLARTIDLCYLTGDRQVRNDEFCEPIRATTGERVPWDDPASPFNGAQRRLFMGDLRLDNNARQTDWYTDIYGEVWSAESFPGSIRQHVGTNPINAAASFRPDPIRSITFDEDLGIHAPN